MQERNQYRRFQGVNRHFNLSYKNNTDRTSYKRYHLRRLKIKVYNVMIDGHRFFNQLAKNNLRKYDDIIKTATGRGDEYISLFLLDYPYFKEYCKMIAINLSKQLALDSDLKVIQ